jgi:dCMP deaminase
MKQETLAEHMFELCDLVASWSKDKSRKTSAVIFHPESGVVASSGWNGFPRGVRDDVPERHERPAKYMWTEHAERNAIYNLVRQLLKDHEMALPWYPCADCARAIIQVGIKRIHCVEPDWEDPKWAGDFAIVKEMLSEAGVEVNFVADRQAPDIGG